MKIKSLILAAVIILTGCLEKEPVSTFKTDNKEITVEYLFTKDNCKVYRFSDAGYPHYFSSCTGTEFEASLPRLTVSESVRRGKMVVSD